MKDRVIETHTVMSKSSWRRDSFFNEDSFSRLDEADDSVFYATDRFVQHLDSLALSTVERIIGKLVVEESPVILDLMAGWDSHIPSTIHPKRVVGLGLNRNELSRNKVLSDWVYHDLNKNPSLPFLDNTFDAVLNVVSVDYMTRPLDIFCEVGRILKPGGLFLVIFSNRMFEQKAVKIWRQSAEEERVVLVEEFFSRAEIFTRSNVFVSKGKPRPKDDKYAHLGIPSDPIYAVYADKVGGDGGQRPRLIFMESPEESPEAKALQRRKASVKHTLKCPHCSNGLYHKPRLLSGMWTLCMSVSTTSVPTY